MKKLMIKIIGTILLCANVTYAADSSITRNVWAKNEGENSWFILADKFPILPPPSPNVGMAYYSTICSHIFGRPSSILVATYYSKTPVETMLWRRQYISNVIGLTDKEVLTPEDTAKKSEAYVMIGEATVALADSATDSLEVTPRQEIELLKMITACKMLQEALFTARVAAPI